jgi:hypothetical protein
MTLCLSAGAAVHAKSVRNSAQESFEKKLIEKAKDIIANELNTAQGTPYLVLCEFDRHGNNMIAASTEIRYTEYRKEPTVHTLAAHRPRSSQCIKVIYRPLDDKYSIVDRS